MSMTVEALAQLQEFVPYAQKHPHASKGYVVGMRRKNARDELDERDVYLSKHQVIEFIERHIAAGQQGDSDLLDDLARIYATIPALPVTAETAEGATNALLAFCYLPAVRKALDLQILPPAPLGDAEEYLRPLRNAIDTADAYATGGPRSLRIVTLRMDEAEAMLARASLATPQPPKPAGAVPLPEPDVDGTVRHPELHVCYTAPVHYTKERLIEYGDAREAAGRADAVPALDVLMRERGMPKVADALGYSRNFAAANPALSQTTRDHIEGLCNMLEIAAHHPATEGLKEWSLRMAEKEIEAGCDIIAGVPDSYEPDDIAVDRFAAAMKEKMAAARAKGRGGWEGPTCNAQLLSDMLRDHVAKGDPRDVANFCMMLWNRGEAIQLPAPAPQPMTTQGCDPPHDSAQCKRCHPAPAQMTTQGEAVDDLIESLRLTITACNVPCFTDKAEQEISWAAVSFMQSKGPKLLARLTGSQP